jgi:hypothetical protein
MTDYSYHDLETLGSIHIPNDLEYASQGARKGASGLEERHEGRLALQTDDGSLWRCVDSATPTWALVAPKVPVVGDIGKFFQIVTDGTGDIKSAWLALSPDEVYNLGSGTRNIVVDAGDYKFSPTGAYSVVFDLAACGSADGFAIEYGGTAWLRIGDTLSSGVLDLSAQFDIVSLAAGASEDLTLGARGETITLNESGQEALGGWFSATSIVGALNEMAGGHTLDDAYNDFGGAGEVEIDNGDLTWTLSDRNEVVFDITGNEISYGGVHFIAGSGGWHFGTIGTGNEIWVEAQLRYFALYTDGNIQFNGDPSTGSVTFLNGAPVIAESYTRTSGNIWSIKATPATASTAKLLRIEADGANWGAGARVLELVSDDDDAKPLAVNNGAGDTAYIERGGGAYFKGYSKFGTGSTSHSLSADGDVLVSGILELNGYLYSDSEIRIVDGFGLVLGTGSDTALGYNATQTPDALMLGLGSDSRGLVICETADWSYDFAHAIQTNPTLFIQSANQSATEWISFAHDKTDGVINTGTGGVKFPGSGGLYLGASSDIHIYRGTAGDLTLGDSITYNDRKLQDVRVNKLWRADCVTDFMSAQETQWLGEAIASGTVAQAAGVANHHGIKKLTSLAGANTGYLYYAGAAGGTLVSAGGDKVVCVFQALVTTNIIYLGMQYTQSAPTRGTYLEISGNPFIATGKTNDGVASSNTTSTSYTCSTSTWYRAEVEVSTDGDTATFRIYTCSNQTLVWSDTLTNYGKGKSLYPSFAAQSSDASGPYDLAYLDFASYANVVDLIR